MAESIEITKEKAALHMQLNAANKCTITPLGPS